MAIFRPKPLEKYQFFDFLQFFFLQPRKAFFRSRISLGTFSYAILPKKKVGKRPIFGPKPLVNPFGKCQFFNFLNQSHGLTSLEKFQLLVFLVQKGVFSLQNIVKDILLKKIVGKMAIFGPKPWVNTFEKMSIFQLVKLFVFIAQKGVFFSRIS